VTVQDAYDYGVQLPMLVSEPAAPNGSVHALRSDYFGGGADECHALQNPVDDHDGVSCGEEHAGQRPELSGTFSLSSNRGGRLTIWGDPCQSQQLLVGDDEIPAPQTKCREHSAGHDATSLRRSAEDGDWRIGDLPLLAVAPGRYRT
jgi:hypothetical protein